MKPLQAPLELPNSGSTEMSTERTLHHCQLLLGQSLKEDWAKKSTLATPILFALTILTVFHFVIGDLARQATAQIYVGEVYLTLLFSLQLIQTRLFSAESNDRAYQLFQTYKLSQNAWFLAKYFQGLIQGCLLLIPTMGFTSLILENVSATAPTLLSWGNLLFALLSLTGLTALGVLLSIMTIQIPQRETIFATMFFPLSIPVLLSGSEGSLAYISTEHAAENDLALKWLLMLICFNVVYFTLGFLLFSELTDQES